MKQNGAAFFEFGQRSVRSTLHDRDRGHQFEKKFFAELGVLGFFNLRGEGTELDRLRATVQAFRQLAKGSLDIPFCVSAVAHWIGVDIVERFGNAAQKDKYLNAALEGRILSGIANSEIGAGTDLRGIKSRVTVNENGCWLSIKKRGATNLGAADLAFCSAWHVIGDEKPSMEVFFIDAELGHQQKHVEQLGGFWTGMTGSLEVECKSSSEIANLRLGKSFSGFTILKHCFNLERLLIGAVVAGVLESTVKLALHLLENKISMGRPLSDHQYVQQKIIDIYTAAAGLNGLIETILSGHEADAQKFLLSKSKELSLLKIGVARDGSCAFQSFQEVGGFLSYMQDSLAQKLVRDHAALKFLGGTQEQQKMVLFQDLLLETVNEENLKKDIAQLIQKSKNEMETADGKKSTQIS